MCRGFSRYLTFQRGFFFFSLISSFFFCRDCFLQYFMRYAEIKFAIINYLIFIFRISFIRNGMQ